MELKAIDFEKILNTELVGKDVGYSHWNFSGAVLRLIRILVKDAGLNEQDFSYKQEGSNNTIYLTYKGVSFGEATFQKQKGKYKYGSYEWTFKKCFVNLWNEDHYSYFKGLTFQEMLDKIVEDKNIAADKEAKKLEQAREIFQLIKDKLGTDDYGARQFVEFLNKNKYSISK
jgi:hypothetical protein